MMLFISSLSFAEEGKTKPSPVAVENASPQASFKRTEPKPAKVKKTVKHKNKKSKEEKKEGKKEDKKEEKAEQIKK